MAARFALGQLQMTKGALVALTASDADPFALLDRHQAGDWGEVGAEDAAENDFSLGHDLRILSSYRLRTGVKVWVITEADRSSTTLLLPSEY
jgi:hypothetical protein